VELDKKFLDQFSPHCDRINEELRATLNSHVSFVEEIGRFSLLGDGKRVRPLLFVLCSHLCGCQREEIYHYSTIFEYVHTASLLHDDVIDKAETRRNKPSACHLWGNTAAVLAGDFLSSKSFDIAIGSNNQQFMKSVAETTIRMAEGQLLELVHTHNWKLKKEEYMKIIIYKTAELMSSACACGGIIAGAEEQAVKHLREFGLNLGIAFQLIDDLLDYTSSEAEFGKPVGKDLREGKITLPLIYSLEKLERFEIERFEKLFKSRRAKEGDYKKIRELVRDSGTPERIRSEARSYADRAISSLSFFPESPVKETLSDLNTDLILRTF